MEASLLADGGWLPLAFAILMGLAILIYVVLDGYDLGVGMLMAAAGDEERDLMVASIGPFWDANETWLVLGIGLLLVAFPIAHGIVLTALYIPVALMLLGLILRGVAFEFRVKVDPEHKGMWTRIFIAGSLLASLAQGYMLGQYILGFEEGWGGQAFSLLTAVCLAAAYVFIGAGWLVMKTEGALQKRAVRWAQLTLWLAALDMAAVSLATPLVSSRIFEKWFSLPNLFLLMPIPAATAILFAGLAFLLPRMPLQGDRLAWAPFAGAVGIFLLGFHGLAYSFFPFVVPDQLTIWQAAAAPESLLITFIGACIVLPFIGGYTVLAYRVFRGKASILTYH